MHLSTRFTPTLFSSEILKQIVTHTSYTGIDYVIKWIHYCFTHFFYFDFYWAPMLREPYTGLDTFNEAFPPYLTIMVDNRPNW